VAMDSDILARPVGHYTAIAVGARKKILPASVLRERVDEKARKVAEKEGRKVGGKERKRIREEILTEMLSQAFVKFSVTTAWIDHKNGWLLVDTSSRATAELVVSTLRKALGSFPAVPAAPEESPRVLMTHWLSEGDLPAGLTLGNDCELRDPATTTGARWRGAKVDLDSEDAKEHLRNGMQVFLLGLDAGGRMSFVLDEAIVLRKINFGDAVFDELGDQHEDALSAFDANFTVISAEVTAILQRLCEIFVIPEVPA
jgi:recombination associated protein RdgC